MTGHVLVTMMALAYPLAAWLRKLFDDIPGELDEPAGW